MATNNNGNLLDDAGEVAIDFVWGNFPIQPNDARPDTATTRLDPALDNHIIALSGWNGFPQYSPDTAGEDVVGSTDYVLVPSVVGLTTALATDAMKDASLVVTAATASSVTKTVTAISRSAGSASATFTASSHGFAIGQKVTIANSGNAAANGVYTITSAPTNSFVATGTSTDVLALTGLSATAIPVAGTVKTQSLAAGQNSVVPGSAVTITSWL